LTLLVNDRNTRFKHYLYLSFKSGAEGFRESEFVLCN